MYSICGIEETTSVKETSIILFGNKYKQLRCENSFYRVVIIVSGTTTTYIPLITICYSPFSLEVYLVVGNISLCPNLQRVYSVGERL